MFVSRRCDEGRGWMGAKLAVFQLTWYNIGTFIFNKESPVKTIATLGPSVRLVVFQFLMKSAQVPAIIPPKRTSTAPSFLSPTPVSGVEVLKSTPGLNIFPLASKITCGGDYALVDVWKESCERNWSLSFIRFVFCHREHVRQDELFHEFIAKREEFTNIFSELAFSLWATQGHLNPYFEKGKVSGEDVLMFGCARRSTRPKPEIDSLSTLYPCIYLADNEVVLLTSKPVRDVDLPSAVAA